MKKMILVVLLITLFTCDDIIEVEDISSSRVSILAPTNASTLAITDINFSWNSVEEAESYQLQIATPDFEMADQIVLDTTITVTNFTKTLDIGSYQWRVRAENSGFQTNYSTQSFTIEE